MSVNERIADILEGQEAEEVIELQLDNCNSGGAISDMKISEKFSRLKRLHLCNAHIRSLDGFPALPSLRRLELADNRIEGGLENLQSLPALKTLNLAGNRIKDLKTLEPLRELEELTTLDLLENPICQSDSGYPEAIFALLPQLAYLDETDREGNPMEEEDDDDDDDDGDDDDSDDDPDADYDDDLDGGGGGLLDDDEDGLAGRYDPDDDEVGGPEDDDDDDDDDFAAVGGAVGDDDDDDDDDDGGRKRTHDVADAVDEDDIEDAWPDVDSSTALKRARTEGSDDDADADAGALDELDEP